MKFMKFKGFLATPAGLEPARAMPNRFQVYLLNHSDTMSSSNTIYYRF